MVITKEVIAKILDDVYAYSKAENFKGYNKHDGLNSPLLYWGCGWGKWVRIAAIQFIMRSPVNVRPLLMVPKTVNPKGIALFLSGLVDRHRFDPGGGYLYEATLLSELLLGLDQKDGWSGSCWGYPYPWQDLGFYAKSHTPNAVVTCFVCEALLEVYRVTGDEKLLRTVGSATDFFLADLKVLKDTQEHLCLSYMPLPMNMRVMDVSILISAVVAQYAQLTGNSEKMQIAGKLAAYVVDQQTDYHAWYYTDPKSDSLIRHDNYHTGFILDALWRYMEASTDWRWKGNYKRGLEFYANHLFNKNGSPRWMGDCDFPHDIHGSAQGLVSLALAAKNGYAYVNMIQSVGNWAIENMYNSKGRFFYQQTRYYTKRFTLLRWCNAWMFRGLSAWLSLSK